ncbi:MAG TPA: hypothetical protein VGT05_02935 [Patescibacteria group bacterium]|nr:hypothetical protein [Patescibacteria group bacterium]
MITIAIEMTRRDNPNMLWNLYLGIQEKRELFRFFVLLLFLILFFMLFSANKLLTDN